MNADGAYLGGVLCSVFFPGATCFGYLIRPIDYSFVLPSRLLGHCPIHLELLTGCLPEWSRSLWAIRDKLAASQSDLLSENGIMGFY